MMEEKVYEIFNNLRYHHENEVVYLECTDNKVKKKSFVMI